MSESWADIENFPAAAFKGANGLIVFPKTAMHLPFVTHAVGTLHTVAVTVPLESKFLHAFSMMAIRQNMVVEINTLQPAPARTPGANGIVTVVKYVPHTLAQACTGIVRQLVLNRHRPINALIWGAVL